MMMGLGSITFKEHLEMNKLTQAQIKQATKKANETRVVPSGKFVVSMRNCNRKFVPCAERLSDEARGRLKAITKEKEDKDGELET